MTPRQTLSILFYLRRDKLNSSEVIPIYLRITVNKRRSEMSAQRSIAPNKWNKEGEKARGSRSEAKLLNEYLDTLKGKVYQAQKELMDENLPVTALALRNQIQGVDKKQHTLINLFKNHNKLMESLVPDEYSPTTLVRYKTTKQHIQNFIKYKYKVEDVFLSQLDHEFVSSLDHYFKVVRNCNHNTAAKYIKNLKKVVNLALKNDWLSKDPFINFSAKIKPVKREYLTLKELGQIEGLEIGLRRLYTVRDVFVFSCYTRLAYVDIDNLTPDNLDKGIDGKLWIQTYRQKTDTKSNIPLLTPALRILEKYENDPETSYSGSLLPVNSNQKMNTYLKELATLAGINKTLTFHLARHTFATTITLANGVPIESVSEMLGHKSIRTTQIYAKVIDKKVSEDMSKLESFLSANAKNADSV